MISERKGAARSAAPPGYFQPIKDRAAKRWDQLEADPELAGPWHQLFKQVQSPRHILSELLQNADDAGASEARVSIENDRFIFQHNGEVCPVALKVGQVSGKRGGAKVTATVTCDARLDEHPA